MKIKNIFLTMSLGVAAALFSSCMDKDWEVPSFQEGSSEKIPYGNNTLKETNVISIAELKQMYPKYAADYTYTLMDKEAQLKVYVTGNDISGNLYNSIAVQDENGDALIICISEGSLYGYLPVGQEILIETKGLYIGGYGSQPQIGTPYTKNGNTYVSRMISPIWQEHFRILPGGRHEVNIPAYTVEEFKKLNIEKDCGKLMTIKGVSIKEADGKKIWADEADTENNQKFVKLHFNGLANDGYMVFTSIYCDFANEPVPTSKMNLTGIWKRYNNSWELIIRDLNDIEIVTE